MSQTLTSAAPTTSGRGTEHQSPTDLPPNAGRAAAGIAVVLVAQLMLILDATVVNVALPHIDAVLDFGPAGLSWVLNAYTLAFGGRSVGDWCSVPRPEVVGAAEVRVWDMREGSPVLADRADVD